jgi:hypothetical protein
MLGFTLEEANPHIAQAKYRILYGITQKHKNGNDLTFKNASKVLGKHIKKNEEHFNRILKRQKKVYKK